MCIWEISRGKRGAPCSGLEFRIKRHPNRERGQEMEPSQGRGSDSQERRMGFQESRGEVWQLVTQFVPVSCWCLVSSPVGSQSSPVDEAPGRGSETIEFLLEDLSLGNKGSLEKHFPEYVVFLPRLVFLRWTEHLEVFKRIVSFYSFLSFLLSFNWGCLRFAFSHP